MYPAKYRLGRRVRRIRNEAVKLRLGKREYVVGEGVLDFVFVS